MARYLFREKNNNYTHNVDGPPVKNYSNCQRNETNCPELETFMTSVEKHLFQNIKSDNIKDNLTCTKRKALTNWRKDNLFKKRVMLS